MGIVGPGPGLDQHLDAVEVVMSGGNTSTSGPQPALTSIEAGVDISARQAPPQHAGEQHGHGQQPFAQLGPILPLYEHLCGNAQCHHAHMQLHCRSLPAHIKGTIMKLQLIAIKKHRKK